MDRTLATPAAELSSSPLARMFHQLSPRSPYLRARTAFPSEGVAAPRITRGVHWSDHWAFWQAGYSAIMITDTAFFRNPHYHLPSDTMDTLDYTFMSELVKSLLLFFSSHR